MAEYGDLLKLLKGEQDQEEPMMSVGEPASISGINEQAKSPYQQEAPEITPEQVLDMPKMQQDIADYSSDLNKPAQEAKLKDTYGAIPDEPELSPQEKLIKELRSIQENKSKEAKTAQEEANKRALLANAIKALGTIGQAQIQRSAGIPIGLKAAEMTAARDASSPILKERDVMLKQMMDEYKMLNQPKDQLSAKDQAYLDYYKDALKLKEKQAEDIYKRQELGFKQRDVDRKLRAEDKVYKVIGDYEKHPVVKELDKQGLSFDQADGLINQMEQGNQIALGALGTKMARAMGEVGVLTDADVKRYIQAQSLVQKAQDSFGRNFMGQLSKETVQDIKEVTNKMKQGFTKKRKDLYDRYIKRAYENYGKEAGLSLEDVETRFAMPSMKQSEQPSIELNPQDKAAIEWLKANPDNPKAEAIRQKLKNKGVL